MMRALTGDEKHRKSDAFREFRSRNWSVHAKIGSPAFKAEQNRLTALWKTEKSGEERLVWESYAHDANHALGDLLGQELNYHEITRRSGGVLADHTGRALKRKLYLETSKEINEHHAWQRGLGIQDSCSALTSQCVDARDLPEKHWREEVSKYFAYNSKEEPNPGCSNQPRCSCSVKCWGRCSTDAIFQKCDIATYNCWATVRGWKLGRNRFPLKIRLSCPHGAEDFLMTDYIGCGETILLLRLCPSGGDLLAVDVGVASKLPDSLTGQRALFSLLDGKPEAAPDLATVKLEHFSLQSARSGRKFSVRSGTEILHTADIPLSFKLKVRKEPKESASSLPLFSHLFTGHFDHRHGTAAEGVEEEMSDFEHVAPSVAHVHVEKHTVAEGEGVPSGSKLGICGYDIAATSRSSCVLCLDCGLSEKDSKIMSGTGRFLFRPKRNVPDRSVHVACVRSGAIFDFSRGSLTHWEDSMRWLSQAAELHESDAELRAFFTEICNIFREHLSRPGSASGST